MMIHLDLDAFFISAERLKDPSLRGVPAAVGGRGDPFIFDIEGQSRLDSVERSRGAFVPSIFYDAKSSFEDYFVEGSKIRGIVITASYEARAYGIRTGMTIREALEICPSLRVVPPNHLYYHDLSHRLHHFLRRRIPKVEQFSIDEFFGDVRGWVAPQETEEFLRSLQSEIADRFGLPISIGAARSKWTAKLATSFAKPKGVKVVRDVESFIQNIPVEKFPGIGRGYLRRLRGYGIRTLGETKGAKELFYAWKKPGITLYKRIWGIDGEPVEPVSPRKSVGISRTIDPLTDRAELERRVTILSRYLAAKIARLGLEPSWYALSLRYECGLKSGAHTRSHRLFGERLLIETMRELLKRCDIHTDSKVVHIGIRVWGFEERKVYDLTTLAQDRKDRKLLRSCTALRSRYGINKIRWARELMQKEGPKRARKWG